MSCEAQTHPLRREAERMLGIGVKLDRGDMLYYVPATGSNASLNSGLFLAKCANAIFLKPSIFGIRSFEAWAERFVKPDPLGIELKRLRAAEVMESEFDLFTQGVKHFELHAPPGAWATYEKRLRQLAAVCLRERRGGGALYACRLCWAAYFPFSASQ